MSTPNFCSMNNFPLLVRGFEEKMAYCPACCLWQDPENDLCECCDGELEIRTEYDHFTAQDVCSAIEAALEDFNCSLLFHKVSLRGGHYSGTQFYVEEDKDPNDYNNEDCHYYFDMCRSMAIRHYHSEINKINRKIRQLAKEYNFEEIFCRAVFSNGEAIYEKVDGSRRSKIRQAVSPLCG